MSQACTAVEELFEFLLGLLPATQRWQAAEVDDDIICSVVRENRQAAIVDDIVHLPDIGMWVRIRTRL